MRVRDRTLSAAYIDIYKLLLATRTFCEGWAGRFNATGGNADELLSIVDVLRQRRLTFQTLSATPGIAAFAQEQENDPAYDIVTEFGQMMTAMEAVMDGIIALTPTDNPTPYLLTHTWDAANRARVPRDFTNTQLSQVIADLNAVVSEISVI